MANNLLIKKKTAVISMLCEGASIRAIERITSKWRLNNCTDVARFTAKPFPCTGHPKAKRAYERSHREGKNDEGKRFVAVLAVPPVVLPITAVRASIIADKKKREK